MQIRFNGRSFLRLLNLRHRGMNYCQTLKICRMKFRFNESAIADVKGPYATDAALAEQLWSLAEELSRDLITDICNTANTGCYHIYQ